MQRIDLVEKVGSGITRMQDAMKEAKLPEPVFTMGGFFTVRFYRPVDFKAWISSIKDKLSEKQYYILQRINAYPQDSTIKTMAELLNTSTRTIERNITVLKELGLLERIGSDKEGHYQINKIPL